MYITMSQKSDLTLLP